jgi:SAM-dependent methyltransferase
MQDRSLACHTPRSTSDGRLVGFDWPLDREPGMVVAREPDWNGIAHRESRQTSLRLWRRFTDRLQLDLFERWAPAGRIHRLLKTDLFDEAVGEGLLPGLRARADRVIGIDLCLVAPLESRLRYPGSAAISCDVRRLPIAAESVDLVVSGSTLDHFETLHDVAVALEEVRRVLRPGGRMMLTMDNLANPAVWLRSVLPFSLLQRTGLVPYFVGKTTGPGGLRRLVEAAGFQVVDSRALMHCPRAPVVAISKVLQHRSSSNMQERLIECLMGFERMRSWPSRNLTAHFSAVLAERPFDA